MVWCIVEVASVQDTVAVSLVATVVQYRPSARVRHQGIYALQDKRQFNSTSVGYLNSYTFVLGVHHKICLAK